MSLNEKRRGSPMQMIQNHNPNFEQDSMAGRDSKPLCNRRILVVEDEVLLAMDLQFSLEEQGAEVVGPSDNVSEASKLAKRDDIDAAILDVDLNGEEVFPVAEILDRAGIPFVFHTGHATREQLEALFPDVPICHKPTLSAELIGTICRLFRQDSC